MSNESDASMKSRPLIIALIVAAVVIAGVAIYFIPRSEPTVLPTAGAPEATPEEAAPPAVAETPAAPTAEGDDLMVAGPLGEKWLGSADAPVTIIEYASMTCSHCQRFHTTTYPTLKTKYIDTGKVRFIFREFPLDSLAAGAIMLARCAPGDNYFPIVELLFEHQREWAFVEKPLDALFGFMRQAGFTQESFRACLSNQEVLDGVSWVRDRAAEKFGVESTPSFFINGKKYAGALEIEELDKIIEPLLN